MSVKEKITSEKITKAFEKTLKEVTFETGRLAIITEEHYERVKKFFGEEVFLDQPLIASFGLGMNPTIDAIFMQYVTQGMSFMLVNPENNDIMGTRLIRVSNEEEAYSAEGIEDLPMRSLMEFVVYTEEKANYYKHFNTKETMTFVGLGVAKKYRRQGIATKLMEAAMCFIRNLDVSPVAVVGATASQYAARIYDKFGYELLSETKYADYKVDGKQVICNTGDHKALRHYGKII